MYMQISYVLNILNTAKKNNIKAVLVSTPPVEIRKSMALSYFHRGQIFFQYELFTFILFYPT